jgi:hypothetical protein
LVCWEWLDEGVSRLGFQPFLLTRSPSGDLVAFQNRRKRLTSTPLTINPISKSSSATLLLMAMGGMLLLRRRSAMLRGTPDKQHLDRLAFYEID